MFYRHLTFVSRPYKRIFMETFNNGQITLFQDDCRTVLPLLHDIDGLVTDPAYKVISGGNGQSERIRPRGMLSANDGKLFDHNDIEFAEWLPWAFSALRDPAHAYIMTNFLNLQPLMAQAQNAGFQLHNLLVWSKNTVTPNRWYMKNCEFTGFFYKGKAFYINDFFFMVNMVYVTCNSEGKNLSRFKVGRVDVIKIY